MKKFILIILLLIFLPTYSVFGSSDIATQSSSMQNEKINYELPYPGILPDNPLYILKVARDKAVSFLISDPFKKAEFDLLVSDKRLNAALFLMNNKKDALSVSTIAKSNNYFHEAVGKLIDAKKDGKDINSLAEKMKISLKKHNEVLKSIEKEIDSKYKEELLYEEKRLGEIASYLESATTP